MEKIIKRIRQSKLARNTGWMLLAQGGRLLLQGIYFIILARVLGAQGYGVLAGTLALISIISPFAGWGSGNLIVQHTSREPESFSVYWGNSILTITVSGTVLTLLVLLLGHFLLPGVPLQLLIGLSLAELFFGRLLDTAGQAFQAFEQLQITSYLNMLLSGARFTAVLLFLAVSRSHTPQGWAGWYLLSSLVPALVGLYLVYRYLGRPRVKVNLVRGNLLEGFYFALSIAAADIYNDIDKTMLARMSTFTATGIYAAAYRIIGIAYVPVTAMLSACYARFFQSGSKGIKGSLEFARGVLPVAAGYGLLATLALLLCAPLVPLILGADYANAVAAIRWLALIPFLRSLHSFAADTLTGAGYQKVRSLIHISAAVFNILLNLWLIPAYSWLGAAWASLVTDGVLVIAMWLTIAVVSYAKPRMLEADNHAQV
jgi:O-antigen/teichoic acid export membrane protein